MKYPTAIAKIQPRSVDESCADECNVLGTALMHGRESMLEGVGDIIFDTGGNGLDFGKRLLMKSEMACNTQGVLRQGSGLVGAEYRDGTEITDCSEISDDNAASGKSQSSGTESNRGH